MKSFSDQIREAIDSSAITRYVLSEKTGITESALSRFMTGKQSLSLTTMDKIADVLGLQVVVGVQARPRTRKPGRPKKENAVITKTKKSTKVDWLGLAMGAAQEAYEDMHSSHRGMYVIE